MKELSELTEAKNGLWEIAQSILEMIEQFETSPRFDESYKLAQFPKLNAANFAVLRVMLSEARDLLADMHERK